jgi:hypothetical protein
MIGLNDTSMRNYNLNGSFTSSSSSSSDSNFAGFLSKYSFELPLAITALTDTKRMVPLDQSYQPGTYDVVCGRGKGSYNRPGNKRFRSLVATYIPQYLKARSKIDKSMVLNDIIDKVRSFTNPDTGSAAQFVKYTKSSGWVLIGDEHAREKVGHAIREAIAAQESSSSNDSTESSSSASPSPTLEIEAVVIGNHCDNEMLSKQHSYFNHLRTVHQRSSLTSLDMQPAVDTLLVGV